MICENQRIYKISIEEIITKFNLTEMKENIYNLKINDDDILEVTFKNNLVKK